MAQNEGRCCGIKLRPMCFFIGYLHLVAGFVNLCSHFVIVAIVTNGFQCDVNIDNLKSIALPWLEPTLIYLNLGTHGFFPYPRVFQNQYHTYMDQTLIAAEPKCYPGILHIYLIDLLNFLINLIWVRIVISYVGAVHKKNPEPMRVFFSLSVLKLVMLAMYFGYQPFFYDVYTPETIWFLKLADILISIFFVMIVQKYAKFLRIKQVVEQNVEKPPSYIECLISTMNPPAYEVQDKMVVVDENKNNKENQESIQV